jgi:3-hydroxyacyl-CoA dehydrogenase
MLEAIRLVERGDATPQDVDTAMKLGAGHPMGPFGKKIGLNLTILLWIVWENVLGTKADFRHSIQADIVLLEKLLKTFY